jgi:hypothetical protein
MLSVESHPLQIHQEIILLSVLVNIRFHPGCVSNTQFVKETYTTSRSM